MQPVRKKPNRPNLFPMGQHQMAVAPMGRLVEGDTQICAYTPLVTSVVTRAAETT